ncbi:MAG TPA: hypothetical protein VHE30_02870 [Polyangiaceae bacterium]|nr:hypothetical protein [Polyangiaceae bacterium]
MAAVVRALLWLLFIVAPGGVFLLPLLVGDAVARRKRQQASKPKGTDLVTSGVPVDPPIAAPVSGH